jgi:hypothetical protein
MYKLLGGDQKEYGPVSADQLRQWIAEGRANGQTLVQADGGAWKPLSTFPEFADALPAGPAGPPATITPPTPLPAAAGSGAGARQMVQGPGIGLVVLGLLGLCLCAVGVFSRLFGWGLGTVESVGNPEIDRWIRLSEGGLGFATSLFQLAFSAVVLAGGLRMISLKNYGLCVAAAVIAVIPCLLPACSCCCVGVAIGIWALVILNKPEVKDAFS